MTKQLQVLLAVKALVAAALPGALVTGFDQDAERPERLAAGGNVLGFPGDPGEPEVDLSPPAYNYLHRIPIEVAGSDRDAMLAAIGAAIAGDRTLGGLCSYLDCEASELGDTGSEMVSSLNWAGSAILAEYQTSNPLG